GQVQADGAHGGRIAVSARDVLNAGAVRAAGDGGVVQVGFTQSYIDTASAVTSAGRIIVDDGGSGRLFSSGRFDATGTAGGSIDLFGQSIALVAATVDASGTAGAGGSIRVGGDYHGDNSDAPDARTVQISGATVLRADAGGFGAGGRVVVWS